MQRLFSVVINYFNMDVDAYQLAAACLFSAALANEDELVLEVIVVDGSLMPDPHLASQLTRIGCKYIHEGRQLTFAEGYNLGASHARAEWIVLCASDVFPSITFFREVQLLISELSSDRIGCIVPRLTISDLPAQESQLLQWGTYALPMMTLNLNVIHRRLLEEIGGVPAAYGGGYNDILMAMRIKEKGRSIFMIPTRCTHYGQLTRRVGGSNFRFNEDRARFVAENPQMVDLGSIWDLRVSSLTTNRFARVLWSASRVFGRGRIRRRVCYSLVTLTALLQRIERAPSSAASAV